MLVSQASQDKEHTATHQILSLISSDPLQPWSSSTHRPEPQTLKSQKNAQEEGLEHEDTDTHVPSHSDKNTHMNDDDARLATRSDEEMSDTAGEEKNESEREKRHVELDQTVDDKKTDVPMELEEKEEELEEQHTDVFRWGMLSDSWSNQLKYKRFTPSFILAKTV